MGAKQVTLFFEDGKSGWTETFYRLDETHENALAAGEALAAKRRGGLAGSAALRGVRVSDVDVFGDSTIETSVPGGTYNATSVEFSRDVSGVGLGVRLEATHLYRRPMTIRGFPDDWIKHTAVGKTNFTPELTAWWNEFSAHLIGTTEAPSGWLLRVISKDLADTQARKITAVGFVGNETINVTVEGAPPPAGQDVKIRGCQGTNIRQVNGKYIVKEVAGQVITLKKRIFMDPVPEYEGKGIVEQQKIVYRQITKAERVGFRTRDTGRVFLQ